MALFRKKVKLDFLSCLSHNFKQFFLRTCPITIVTWDSHMSRGQNCLICAAKVSRVSEIGAVPSVRISRDEIDLIEKMSTDIH